MKEFWIGIVVISISLNLFALEPVQQYRVDLAPDDIDRYECYFGFVVVMPADNSKIYHEKVTAVPEGYRLIYTYSIPLRFQRIAEKFGTTTGNYRDILGINSGNGSFQLSIDDIVTVGAVEDFYGKLYLIYDHNNDEDLSNDPISNPVTKSISFKNGNKHQMTKFMDGQVIYDSFEKEEVKTKSVKLRSRCIGHGFAHLGTVYTTGHFGQMTIEGQSYRVGLINRGDIDYREDDYFWVDLNQNDRLDSREDFLQAMNRSFELFDMRLLISDIESSGQYITLDILD